MCINGALGAERKRIEVKKKGIKRKEERTVVESNDAKKAINL
jgi:hypothetical protein